MQSTMKDRLRTAVSHTIRPVWRRIWARIETRLQPIETRLQTTETRLRTTETRLEVAETLPQPDTTWISHAQGRLEHLEARVSQFETGWRQHVAGFLNAVSTVSAYGHVLATFKREAEQSNKRLSADLEAINDRVSGELEAVNDRVSDELNGVRQELIGVRQQVSADLEALAEKPALFRPSRAKSANCVRRCRRCMTISPSLSPNRGRRSRDLSSGHRTRTTASRPCGIGSNSSGGKLSSR